MAFNKMSNKEAERWQRKQDEGFGKSRRYRSPKVETADQRVSIGYLYEIKYETVQQPIPEPRMSPYEIEWHQDGVQQRYRIMIDNSVDFNNRIRRQNGLPDDETMSAMLSKDFYYFVTSDGSAMKVRPHQTGPYDLELAFDTESVLYDKMPHHENWRWDHEQRCFYDQYWRWKKDHEPDFLDALKEA